MFNKKLTITIIALVVISVGTFLYHKSNSKPKTPPFVTQKPIRKDLVQYVNSSGTLKAKDQITIGSLEAGRVVKIIADNNDYVKKDQVLAILDNGFGYSAVKKAKGFLEEAAANLKYQEKFYLRQTQLYESEQISKDLFEQYTKNLEMSKAKVFQAEAELEIQEKTFENLFIKAPDDGVVIAKEIDLGQMITARLQATILYEMAKDLHMMEAQVDVDESDIGMVKEGQEASFTVDAFPRLKFEARVRQIRYLAKIVDNVVTYATLLDVDNPDLILRPGMTTDVNIKVAEAKNALSIHNKALRIDSEMLEAVAKKIGYTVERIPNTAVKTEIDHVWVLEDQTFKQVKVTKGVVQGRYTQITGDINDNSNIITEVAELNRENLVLKQLFQGAGGGIGKK